MLRLTRQKLLYFSATLLLLWAVGVWVTFPIWLNHFVSQELLSFSNYSASYSRVDVSVFQVKYTLSDVTLKKKGSRMGQPLFSAKSIDFCISFKDLLKGKLTGNIVLHQPKINFISAVSSDATQLETDYPWENIGRRLLGVELNEIRIVEGSISFHDIQSSPNVLLHMRRINIQASNMGSLPGSDELSGKAFGSAEIHNGRMNFDLRFNPHSELPVFNLTARLENFDLSYLADYLKSHGNYAIDTGMFSMMTQVSGEAQSISGFVKPLLETIRLASTMNNEHELQWMEVKNPFNRSFPQTSFHSDLDFASQSVWSAVAFTMRNAFFEALTPVIQKIHASPGSREPQQRKLLLLPRKGVSA